MHGIRVIKGKNNALVIHINLSIFRNIYLYIYIEYILINELHMG